jgi:beta-glucanase (GH16 family)
VGAVIVALGASCQSSSSKSGSPKSSNPAATKKKTTTTTSPAPKGWKLVLNENFDGNALSKASWSHCYWWSTTTCTNLATKELEVYTARNVQVAKGTLRLTAKREAASTEGRSFDYTSGMISGASPDRIGFSLQYGYIEARVRVPKGQGLWSAFWMLPVTRQPLPEIDIFEVVGEETGRADHHVHWAGADREQALGQKAHPGDLSAGWHVFGLKWEPEALTWTIDGKRTWRMTKQEAIPQEPMYLIVDLAVGGNYPKPPNAQTPFPSTLLVDYIRAWKRP